MDSGADVLTAGPAKDNTIYSDMSGTNSNGAGIYLFSGTQSSSGWARRALMQFDLSSIPAGSTVNSASLSLRVSMTISGGQNMGAHLMTSDWGEGTSDAPGQEGGGTAATDGDATWVSAFHPSTAWASAGGDFEAVASASTSVGGSGSTPTWASAGLAADVQAWVDGVKPNYGWTIKHQDEIAFGTAKRFGSRENSSSSSRPVLTINYTPGSAAAGVGYCFGDGTATACPCGNTGGAGQGCANDSGLGSVLESTGSNSVGADDLILSASNLPSGPGLFFQGNNAVNSGNGNPFGDGLRCAGGGVRRLEVQFANAANGFSTSTTTSVSGGGAVSAGDTKRYQYWYRDAGTSPCSTLFNLSNGYEITWSA
jgi:hypothetical protein